MQAITILLPECALLMIIILLFLQCLRPLEGNVAPYPKTSWLPLAAASIVIIALASLSNVGLLFYGTYRIDALSQFFKLAIALGFFVVILNSAKPTEVEEYQRPDYLLFLALSTWGLMLLASAVEMVTMYVALEISSYSLYVLIPLRTHQDKHAAEAGIKYILFGALATALALYGYSYVLATRHSSFIADLAHFQWHWSSSPMAVLGLGLFLCGMFFKLALFPFHFWCPDLYQGASNETATFAATLPKLGAVVALVRFGTLLHSGQELTTIIAIFGALSMTLGNLCALAQRDLKRLLGYSSIAHAGYITLGLITGTPLGLAGASFYSLVYLLMNQTIFWVICRLAPDGRNLTINDLDGLFRRDPALALILAVSAFALLGLPPTAGFMAKFFLLAAAWNHGYNWLVVVAVLNTAISLYYYLSIVRHAYTKGEDPKVSDIQYPNTTPMPILLLGGALATILLLIGIMPGPIYDFVLHAGNQLLP
ncbi:NADH-quinone oxidoreductase subunit N 2 [Desulfovibrionales bacterium]